jgi:hypothetical protein
MERHGVGFLRTSLRARAGLSLAALVVALTLLAGGGRSAAEVLSADQIHQLDSKGVAFVDGARILAVEQLGPKPQVTPDELALGPTGLPPASAGTNGSFQPHTAAEREQILARLRRGGAPARSVGKAFATWYGPTLYGNGVACGGTLTPNTIGVAHKTLPCGTELVIGYNGHWERAKVIDRGPYGTGAQYDLTEALAERLGFISTGFGEIQVAKVG